MIIVLINWRILPDKVEDFVQFWKSTLSLKDAPGLIGEFLSEVEGPSTYEKITWEMEPSDLENKLDWASENYLSFVNVGIWDSIADFDRAVGPKMNPDPRFMNEYEAAPRRRAVLTPKAWRIGKSSGLPSSSSKAVVP